MNSEENIRPRPIGDRIFGLARAAFAGWMTYELGKNGLDALPFTIIGSALTLEGLADVVAGEHHYLPERIIKYFENRKQENAS